MQNQHPQILFKPILNLWQHEKKFFCLSVNSVLYVYIVYSILIRILGLELTELPNLNLT